MNLSSYSLFNHPGGSAFGASWGNFSGPGRESMGTMNVVSKQGLTDEPIRALFEESSGSEADLRRPKSSDIQSQKPSLSTSTSTTSSIWSNAPNPSQQSSVSVNIGNNRPRFVAIRSGNTNRPFMSHLFSSIRPEWIFVLVQLGTIQHRLVVLFLVTLLDSVQVLKYPQDHQEAPRCRTFVECHRCHLPAH